MGHFFFLQKLVFVWVYFQILWRHIPTKTKLEYPPRIGLLHLNSIHSLSCLWKIVLPKEIHRVSVIFKYSVSQKKKTKQQNKTKTGACGNEPF